VHIFDAQWLARHAHRSSNGLVVDGDTVLTASGVECEENVVLAVISVYCAHVACMRRIHARVSKGGEHILAVICVDCAHVACRYQKIV
jgi:hypothetical protein